MNKGLNIKKIYLIDQGGRVAQLVQKKLARLKRPRVRVERLNALEGLLQINTRLAYAIIIDLTKAAKFSSGSLQALKSVGQSIPIIGVVSARAGRLSGIRFVDEVIDVSAIDAHWLLKIIPLLAEQKKISATHNYERLILKHESEELQDGILIIDVKDKVLFINNQLIMILSLNKKGLTRMSGSELIVELSNQLIYSHDFVGLYHKLLGEGSRRHQQELALKSGRSAMMYSQPIKDGQLSGRIWFFRDISEQKAMEMQKNEFISTVSHELRSPLAIITGSISNLKDGILGEMTDKQSHVIEVTSKSLDRINRLLNDLLDLSRLESGRVKLKKKEINLSVLLNEILQPHKSIMEKAGLAMSLQVNEDIPFVFADPDRLSQVITNYLSNALRYARSRTEIRVSRVGTGLVKVEVTDDGDGIREEDLPRLFHKFEQISRRAGHDAYKGTGLGLAICKEIITQHGGEVGVQSQIGQGSTFYFEIPLSRVEEVLDERFRSYLLDDRVERMTLLVLRITPPSVIEDLVNRYGNETPYLTQLQDKIAASCLRRSDFIIHDDQGEYRILMPQGDDLDVHLIIGRIHEMLRKTLKQETDAEWVARFSWADFPKEGTSLYGLLKRAYEKI